MILICVFQFLRAFLSAAYLVRFYTEMFCPSDLFFLFFTVPADDGISDPRTKSYGSGDLPSARIISNIVHKQDFEIFSNSLALTVSIIRAVTYDFQQFGFRQV